MLLLLARMVGRAAATVAVQVHEPERLPARPLRMSDTYNTVWRRDTWDATAWRDAACARMALLRACWTAAAAEPIMWHGEPSASGWCRTVQDSRRQATTV